jgi:hypothetical protein
MAKELPKHVQKERKWLDDNEMAYRQAAEITSDVDGLRALLRGLKVKMEPLMSYNADIQPAHSAVAVVSSSQERLAGLFQDLEFVEEYEDRKERYVEEVKAFALGDDETQATG